MSVVCTPTEPAGAGASGSPACKIAPGSQPGATAVAEYTNSINTTGWGDFKSYVIDRRATPSLGAFAAGYLEGYMTNQQICDFAFNLNASSFVGEPANLRNLTLQFLWDNYNWAVSMIHAENNSLYWAQVGVCVLLVMNVERR
jgi:hypothetical protein